MRDQTSATTDIITRKSKSRAEGKAKGNWRSQGKGKKRNIKLKKINGICFRVEGYFFCKNYSQYTVTCPTKHKYSATTAITVRYDLLKRPKYHSAQSIALKALQDCQWAQRNHQSCPIWEGIVQIFVEQSPRSAFSDQTSTSTRTGQNEEIKLRRNCKK